MMIKKSLLLAATLAFAIAQGLRAEESCRILHAKNVFDGKVLLGERWLEISGKTIRGIHERKIDLHKSCPEIDLGSSTLLPGLIDLHTHIFLTDDAFHQDFGAELVRWVKLGPSVRYPFGKKIAKELLDAGFTTLRDLGNSGNLLDLKLRKDIDEGLSKGPRIIASGPGIAIKEGQFPVGTPEKLVAQEYRVIHDANEASSIVAKLREAGVDWIKAYADNDPNPAVPDPRLLGELVRAAHSAGLKIAVHATMDATARSAVLAGADSIEHGCDIKEETLRLMAAKKTTFIPTDLSAAVCAAIAKHTSTHGFESCPSYLKNFSTRTLAARKLGVPIAFGSDAFIELATEGYDRARSSLESLFALVEEGLSPEDALRAATANAGALLGKPLGKIQEGFTADLIAVRGNPAKSIRVLEKVVFVMKNGVVLKN